MRKTRNPLFQVLIIESDFVGECFHHSYNDLGAQWEEVNTNRQVQGSKSTEIQPQRALPPVKDLTQERKQSVKSHGREEWEAV